MIAEFHDFKERYFSWLKEKTLLQKIGDWVEVTTPFLDRHNDYMQMYVRRSETGYLLSDDGYTISDLEMCGCELNTPKRRALLQLTLNRFGVQHNENTKELYVCASSENFELRKHNLLQAMLAVNDLFYLATQHIRSFFLEDVESWLDAYDIRFSSNVNFIGRSGLSHHFDFLIPKSKIMPERALLSINRPDRSTVERTLFAWSDTIDNRSSRSRAYVILNDEEKPVSDSFRAAFTNCGINPVPWSERESVREELAA